jgi:hypothetical protein
MKSTAEQASDRVSAVDAAFEKAEGEWRGVGLSLGELIGVTPQSQVLSAIKQMRTLGRDPWSLRRNKLAESDKDGWARWVQDGNDMLKNLASTAQEANSASIQGIVFDTVVTSAAEVKQAAKSVWSAKYLIVTGIVAVAVIAVMVRR